MDNLKYIQSEEVTPYVDENRALTIYDARLEQVRLVEPQDDGYIDFEEVTESAPAAVHSVAVAGGKVAAGLLVGAAYLFAAFTHAVGSGILDAVEYYSQPSYRPPRLPRKSPRNNFDTNTDNCGNVNVNVRINASRKSDVNVNVEIH